MADVLVRNEGSIIMLTPSTPEGKAWIDENLGLESWQWLGNSCAIEWRYAPDIVNGMQEAGLEVIPAPAEITDDDRQGLSRLGITASKKKATEPLVPLRPEIAERTPYVPGAAGSQAPPLVTAAVAPQQLARGIEESLAIEQEEKGQEGQQSEEEKHTILPELPNAMFHMAADNTDVAAYWDSASFDTRQEIVHRSSLRTGVPRYQQMVSLGLVPGPKEFSDKEAYEIAGTPWKKLLIGVKMELISTVQNYMGYGTEDLGETVPEFDEDTKSELKSMGITARGGWHRISQNTIVSDDKRFSITLIDATRRSKWFLLKDTETGKSYENRTMTDAKARAKKLREGGSLAVSEPAPEEVKEASSPFTNGLLKSKKHREEGIDGW